MIRTGYQKSENDTRFLLGSDVDYIVNTGFLMRINERKVWHKMILSNQVMKEIESHFYNWQQERKYIDDTTKEIAQSVDYSKKLVNYSGSEKSDPVFKRMLEIDEQLGKLKKWCLVVEKTAERYKNTPYSQFLSMVYTEQLSKEKVCDALCFERRNFFRWRKEILHYAAFIAYKYDLIEI